MLEIEPRTSCMLGKCCVTELQVDPCSCFVLYIGEPVLWVLCCCLQAEAPVDVLHVCSGTKMAFLDASSHLKRLCLG